MDDGPVKTPTPWAGQVKGWFRNQAPAGERVPASEHLTHGARENEQLAEIVGLLQHVANLLEAVWGQPRYRPVLATLNGQTSVDVIGLPNGHAQLDNLIISSDTAVSTVTITLFAASLPGGSAIIYQGSLPTGMPPALPLNVDLPPDATRLNILCSTAPTHAYAQFLFSPVLPDAPGGNYPYVR